MKQYRIRLSDEREVEFVSNMVSRKLNIKSRPRLTQHQYEMLMSYRRSDIKKARRDDELEELKRKEKMFDEIIELTSQKGVFDVYEIKDKPSTKERSTIAIAQMSDQHIDEVVLPESVLYLNEFNLEIAKDRISYHFAKLAKLIKHHQSHYNINKLVVLLQGDMIGGWIHDELAQTNSIAPNHAIYVAKSLIVSGLKHLNETLDVDSIEVVCVGGNHTRESRRVQFANFNDTNKEYWMYLDIESTCNMIGLEKVSFIIPKAEMAILNIFGKNYLIAHGHQFKYSGGVGGIFPSMLRWFGSIAKTLKVETAFIGHWHQSIFTNKVIVNGTVKGYDAFAMSKGLEFSKPSQNLVLLDSEYGFCNFQQIYL